MKAHAIGSNMKTGSLKKYKLLLVAFLACGQLPVMAEQPSKTGSNEQTTSAGYHKKFDNAELWAKVFDNPERDKWQKPQEVITALRIKPDDKVADIGAGTGYFTFRIARDYPKSTVYAADVEPDMVKYLDEQARLHGFANVVATAIPTAEPSLPAKANLVIVVDTYHHIDDRIRYFKKLKEFLLPDGRLAIVDFTSASPIGPPAKHRISSDKVRQELNEAGYDLAEDLNLLPYQHFLIFHSSPSSSPGGQSEPKN